MDRAGTRSIEESPPASKVLQWFSLSRRSEINSSPVANSIPLERP
jgi:hypothetical protein